MNNVRSSLLLVALATAVSVGCDGGSSGASASPAEQNPPTSVPIAAITYDALFVVNGGDSTVSVINTETNALGGTIVLNDASFPHHVYLSADRARLLVAVPGTDLSEGHSSHVGHGGAPGGSEGAVIMLDANTGATITSRRLEAMNHNAIFSPSGKEIWTAQFDGFVLVLDPNTLATMQSVAVGTNPSEVTFSSDGRRAFVADTGSNTVSVVDANSKAPVATIPVGVAPVGAWQGRNGIAYVDNEEDGTVTAIDTSTLDVTLTYDLGYTPGMVGFGPDGNVWVSDSYNGRVVLWAVGSSSSIAQIPTGAGAHGVAFSGDGKNAYVSNQDANTVTVIDVVKQVAIATIPVGIKPNGMAWRSSK